MLQVIITATLLITGLLAPKEPVNQESSLKKEVCLETNEKSQQTDFHSKQNSNLFQESTNPKKENERETI